MLWDLERGVCSTRVIGGDVICSASAGKCMGVVRQVPIIVRHCEKSTWGTLGCLSYSIMLYIFLVQFLKEKKNKVYNKNVGRLDLGALLKCSKLRVWL